ncbi:hypothetical protein ACGYLO_20190, partial [Sulfitobacter sp. 1A13353]|uniref:hypothetical protein n=1 Tax=Sulfitobacter sp. 1A13353 TaxID=3368568 RepID=UPI003746DD7E
LARRGVILNCGFRFEKAPPDRELGRFGESEGRSANLSPVSCDVAEPPLVARGPNGGLSGWQDFLLTVSGDP